MIDWFVNIALVLFAFGFIVAVASLVVGLTAQLIDATLRRR